VAKQVQWELVPRSQGDPVQWRARRSELWRKRNLATTQYADAEAAWLADDTLNRLLGQSPSTMGVVAFEVCRSGDLVADCWLHVEPSGRTRRASLWEFNAAQWSGSEAEQLVDELVHKAQEHGASGLEVRAFRGDHATAHLVSTGKLHRISSLMVRRIDSTPPPTECLANITLEPMTIEQYEDNREHLVSEYASSLVRAGIFDEREAAADAKRQTAMMMPRGLFTKSHSWFVLKSADETVGTLWLFESRIDSSGHIYDVEIAPQHRGRGFGRAAMIAAENYFRGRNARYLELNVFGYNNVARALYESLGYVSVEESFIRDSA
jgi:ribosomal protein S18 acetylase RimI-like enzyme